MMVNVIFFFSSLPIEASHAAAVSAWIQQSYIYMYIHIYEYIYIYMNIYIYKDYR